MIRAFVQDRWFPLISLLFSFAASVLWYISGGALTWEPALIALFPWVMRVLNGRFPFKRTSMDGFLLLFLATGAASISVAYNPDAATGKFWLLVGSVLLFQELAGQSRRDVWLLASLLGVLSVAAVGYFLLTNNWHAIPSDIPAFTWLGQRWMAVRPNLDTYPLFANQAAGILAIVFPFQLALWRYARQAGHELYERVALVTGAIALFGLVFTSSRAAWVALAVPLALWWLWQWCEQRAINRRLSGPGLFAAIVGMLGAATAVTLVAVPRLSDLVSGFFVRNATIGSRSLLAQETWHLIGDYPFIGAGLATFGGLYSQYIAVTPFFQFSYGHQFWLDVILEQGVLGLLAWLGIYAVTIWLLVKTSDQQLYVKQTDSRVGGRGGNGKSRKRAKNQSLELGLFRWAIVMSIMVLLIHSAVDDPLYASRGTPFLFLLPGLAVAVSTRRQARPLLTWRHFLRIRVLAPALLIVGVLGATAVLYQQELRANWTAMQGAVAMSRVELVGWPTGRWDRGENVDKLAPAAAQFEKALALSPTNRTAHHRLGLIAMSARDYNTAVAHLESALAVDANHRGIRKSLGYSYVWLGEYERALALLAPLEEAHWEMNNYVDWWARNGREDLSEHAAAMRLILLEHGANGNTATSTP